MMNKVSLLGFLLPGQVFASGFRFGFSRRGFEKLYLYFITVASGHHHPRKKTAFHFTALHSGKDPLFYLPFYPAFTSSYARIGSP